MYGLCFDLEDITDAEDTGGDYICLCADGSVGKTCDETGIYT
jgi:hypothetical protein